MPGAYIAGTLKVEKNTYYYCYFDGCMGNYFWIRKSDGKKMDKYFFPTFYNRNDIRIGNYKNSTKPIFAPDKKTFIFRGGCEYSDNNDCDGGKQSINFNIGEFQNDVTKILFRFEELRVEDFRFITNRSGVAKMHDNSYLKITMKK